MASLANSSVSESPCVHIFHELPTQPPVKCEVCKEGLAAYCWTKQAHEDLLQGPDQIVCRVCAGMILLVGTTYQTV